MFRTDLKRIYLVGPMGAGKTSIGKSLALLTQLPFLDIDEEIVRVEKRSIPAIFSEDGESGFRKIETEVLKKCSAYEGVIATGGGVVVTPENLDYLKNSGIVVYLYADVKTQFLRTSEDLNRPMLHVEDRFERLKQIFDFRAPLYQQIQDLTIDTCNNNVRACVEKIIGTLKEQKWNQLQ